LALEKPLSSYIHTISNIKIPEKEVENKKAIPKYLYLRTAPIEYEISK